MANLPFCWAYHRRHRALPATPLRCGYGFTFCHVVVRSPHKKRRGRPQGAHENFYITLRMKTHIYVAIAAAAFILDQITKFWADSHTLGWSVSVIGDLLRFTLAYNEGAAFSISPQKLAPWLSPTVFFGILTAIACAGAVYFFRSLHKQDYLSRISIVLIIAGALGNFCDRLRIGKVVDFIDVDFPDSLFERWPTFNLADSWVTIGIVLLFIGAYLVRPKKSELANDS